MCVFNGFGQSNFSWFLRTHPNILEIYSKLLKTRDLITSLDGFSLVVSNKQQSKSWHHVDQNPQNDILSYQASYNYFKVDENDAGFVIAPKSHLEFKPEVSHKRNWIKVPIDSMWNEKVLKLCIPENCFTIWNSKTIHANTGITKKHKITKINRLTVYIPYVTTRITK